MHMKRSDNVKADPSVKVRFIIEDPLAITGDPDKKTVEVMASPGESILEIGLDHGVNIEHACGGVCACSTCHVYINQGEDDLPEASDEELDRVEEAPGLQINSRLACQCTIEGQGPIEVQIPAWNRNAVKEVPH